jgi:formylglycine-generating enzyme required for sulfatase activity
MFKSGNTREGISDLSGNVWEWCTDWYDKHRSYRVLRGGSWSSHEQLCRSAYRRYYPPGYRGSFIGFRLVFVP